LIVVTAAVAVASPFLGRLSSPTHGWVTFVLLSIGTAIAQLFVVVTPRRGQKSEGTLSYHTTGVFLLPAALLLAPQLAAMIAIVQHVPEWLKKRQPWYIATFNIANYTLTILAALGVNRFVLTSLLALIVPARGGAGMAAGRRRGPGGPTAGRRRR